jgi:hypothetical protein
MAESSRDCETLEEGGFTNGVWWVLPDWEEWRVESTGEDKKKVLYRHTPDNSVGVVA